MINGPDNCQLNKMDTLVIALALEVAIRQEMMIEEQVDEDSNEDDNKQLTPGPSKQPRNASDGRLEQSEENEEFQYVELD